ncbi:recombinase family protein [Brevibacterium aurantiacum]|uniref:Transposase n=1 Tax=Brevibacterium aurantiacum TaxID=273384 RepID=A0A2A3ZD78_BREAU|nr:recombinase family protein [Brevibacterium aurantiacum]PCC49447.1 transposase [Brevibacterium aurantiacum]
MNKHTVAYVRVSSADQNEARQLEALEASGGYDKLFVEKISAKNRQRPELDAMLSHVREGDVVRVKSIDRLARSTSDLLGIVQDLSDKGVSVEFLDTPEMNVNSAQGKFMLTVMGAFAELERTTIKERQSEGIEIAKAEGRFAKKKALSPQQIEEAAQKREDGVSVADLAKDLGVSKQTLYTAFKTA